MLSLQLLSDFVTTWAIAHQVPLSWDSQQGWEVKWVLLQGIVLTRDIKPMSPTLQAKSLPLSQRGSPPKQQYQKWFATEDWLPRQMPDGAEGSPASPSVVSSTSLSTLLFLHSSPDRLTRLGDLIHSMALNPTYVADDSCLQHYLLALRTPDPASSSPLGCLNRTSHSMCPS